SARSSSNRSTTARSRWRKPPPSSPKAASSSRSRAAAIRSRRSMRPGSPIGCRTCRPPAAPSSNGSRARPCRASRCCARSYPVPPAVAARPDGIANRQTARQNRRNRLNGNVKEAAMNLAELNKIAEAMVTPGRGILAADESSGTIKKRFDAIGVESTADNRRDYRELLFRSTDAMSRHISGVILYDETIRQNARDGTPLVKVIEQAGSLPGIKVDKGTKPLPFCPGEVLTEGLDGLRERLAEYRGLGAKFAKWRAVIDIAAGIPTYTCVKANSHALARYAALCQDEGIVPI